MEPVNPGRVCRDDISHAVLGMTVDSRLSRFSNSEAAGRVLDRFAQYISTMPAAMRVLPQAVGAIAFAPRNPRVSESSVALCRVDYKWVVPLVEGRRADGCDAYEATVAKPMAYTSQATRRIIEHHLAIPHIDLSLRAIAECLNDRSRWHLGPADDVAVEIFDEGDGGSDLYAVVPTSAVAARWTPLGAMQWAVRDPGRYLACLFYLQAACSLFWDKPLNEFLTEKPILDEEHFEAFLTLLEQAQELVGYYKERPED